MRYRFVEQEQIEMVERGGKDGGGVTENHKVPLSRWRHFP